MNLFNPFNYIPPQITVWIKPALYTIAVVALFATGWTVNGWRYQAKIDRAEQDRLETIAEAMKEAQKLISKADQKYVEDMADAKKTIDGLRYCISHGTCRVSIPTKLSTTNSSGSSNGKTVCEPSEAFTNDLISIAEDGDRAIIKLTACQNILKGLSL